MPKITFIEFSGAEHNVDASAGISVMEAAIQNLVPGIDGECGGALSCATCHVYVDANWSGQTGQPTDMETDMLDFAIDIEPNSRLSCQIQVTDDLDGLVVRLPETQS